MSCSYCYNEGHNRRTCTVLTERLERDQASGSGYAKDALAARGKGSGSDKTNRRCSFCGTRGHDRRTCLSLGEYTTRMTDDWLAVRNAVFDKASANEFSVGSLVSFRQKDYDYESNTYIESHPVGLVEGISWGEINDGTINSRQKTVFVSYYSSDTTTGDRSLARRTKWIALPAEITQWTHDLNGKSLQEPQWGENHITKILSASGAPTRNSSHTLTACRKAVRTHIKDQNYSSYSSSFRKYVTLAEEAVLVDKQHALRATENRES